MAATEAKTAMSTGTARRSSSVLGRWLPTLPRIPCQIGAVIANYGCCAEFIRDIRSPFMVVPLLEPENCRISESLSIEESEFLTVQVKIVENRLITD